MPRYKCLELRTIGGHPLSESGTRAFSIVS